MNSDPCVRPQPSERVRVEVVALSLKPESRVARDSSVVRLFVEYSFLDLPTEETPLSLPKPPQGKSINYNYSKGKILDLDLVCIPAASKYQFLFFNPGDRQRYFGN